jgi:hypothetical protein
MRTIRHFLLLISLMFWQGGFMFYGGVVVPIGGRILGSESLQGLITQSATNYLNLAGIVCMTFWGNHLWRERKLHVSRFEWCLFIGTVCSLVALAVIHLSMDLIIDVRSVKVVDPVRFDLYHKLYISISSVQWLASLLLLFLSIRRWNRAA